MRDAPSTPSIGDLPVELIPIVASSLSTPDINSWALTCKSFYQILNPILYRLNVRDWRSCVRGMSRACLLGNTGGVKKFLEYGAKIDRTYSTRVGSWKHGRKQSVVYLHIAIENGHLELVTLLIAHNANIARVGMDRRRALHFAKDLDMVRTLLAAGAQEHINSLGGNGGSHSPLDAMVNANVSLEVVQLMLDSGAKPYQLSSFMNPVIAAMMHERADVVDLLVQHGGKAINGIRPLSPIGMALHIPDPVLNTKFARLCLLHDPTSFYDIKVALHSQVGLTWKDSGDSCFSFPRATCLVDGTHPIPLESFELLLGHGASIEAWMVAADDDPVHRLSILKHEQTIMTNLQYLLAMIYAGDRDSLSHEDERKVRALIQLPRSTSMNVPMQPEQGSPIVFWLLDSVSSSYPQKKLRLIQMLLETMPIDIKDPEGRTPLLHVLQQVHSPDGTLAFTEDLVRIFLEAAMPTVMQLIPIIKLQFLFLLFSSPAPAARIGLLQGRQTSDSSADTADQPTITSLTLSSSDTEGHVSSIYPEDGTLSSISDSGSAVLSSISISSSAVLASESLSVFSSALHSIPSSEVFPPSTTPPTSCVCSAKTSETAVSSLSFLTTPFANLSTFTSPSWTTLPVAQLTTDPFCVNEASPHEGIDNHCVCKNGATIAIIPYTAGSNLSDYQPCAYTTVDESKTNTSSTVTAANKSSTFYFAPSPVAPPATVAASLTTFFDSTHTPIMEEDLDGGDEEGYGIAKGPIDKQG
ncbi:hypothetical protein B0T19DRAFT_468367 [Cercophora scortea]|uniref:Uncharacterized protein n=1 Tax=Cercophora scortea TaxID=314031 RepID=A0AAE0I7W5_9PEZI|nr:hypothetical protein B0T19DRAFT_468367 [Cercophora scortea]